METLKGIFQCPEKLTNVIQTSQNSPWLSLRSLNKWYGVFAPQYYKFSQFNMRPEGGHQRFVQCLLDWISSCEWFTCCVGESLTDTSWFEIFAHFVHDTDLIPPFEYSCFSTGKKEFILPGDKKDWMLSVPTTFQSFQAWRKVLSSWVEGGLHCKTQQKG